MLTEASVTTMDSFSAYRMENLYPSYRSFDEFIDIEQLRSLDSYITRKIRRHIHDGTASTFFVNQHVLDATAPYRPGVREIWLKRTLPGTPYDYLDIDRTELWQVTPDATDFTLLMDFIETLPFESTGRILLIYDDSGNSVPAHRDHEQTNLCHDFVWFRTNRRKPFYVLNQHTGERLFIEGYSAWFDTVNQYHGSDAADGLNFSIRVDGHFTNAFKDRIPYGGDNAAATPALWAAELRSRV